MQKDVAWYVVHLALLALFVLAVVRMAQAADYPSTREQTSESRSVKLPIGVETEIGYCKLIDGAKEVKLPCAYLTVVYEDGSKERRLVAENREWKKVLSALGDAIDHEQVLRFKILKERMRR